MVVRGQCATPACNKQYQVDESQLGRIPVCKHFGQKFMLTASDGDTTRAFETGGGTRQTQHALGTHAGCHVCCLQSKQRADYQRGRRFHCQAAERENGSRIRHQ